MATLTAFMQVYVFVLAGFVGFQVVSKVPALLHTPLMSAANAITGISLVGSLVAAGSGRGFASNLLGSIAVACRPGSGAKFSSVKDFVRVAVPPGLANRMPPVASLNVILGLIKVSIAIV